MWNKALWVGLPRSEAERWRIRHGDMTGLFAYFRLELDLRESGNLTLQICANSRCRLWVNGVSVCSGPCKGDLHRCYYETVDVTTGEGDGRVFLDGSRYLTSDEVTSCLGAVMETADFGKFPYRWREPDFDVSSWGKPEPLEPVGRDGFMERVGLLRRFPLYERPIPLLYETPREFLKARRAKNGALIPDTGEETGGYPVFRHGLPLLRAEPVPHGHPSPDALLRLSAGTSASP